MNGVSLSWWMGIYSKIPNTRGIFTWPIISTHWNKLRSRSKHYRTRVNNEVIGWAWKIASVAASEWRAAKEAILIATSTRGSNQIESMNNYQLNIMDLQKPKRLGRKSSNLQLKAYRKKESMASTQRSWTTWTSTTLALENLTIWPKWRINLENQSLRVNQWRRALAPKILTSRIHRIYWSRIKARNPKVTHRSTTGLPWMAIRSTECKIRTQLIHWHTLEIHTIKPSCIAASIQHKTPWSTQATPTINQWSKTPNWTKSQCAWPILT